MDELFLKNLAQQLRKPEGEMGLKVGSNMNTGNELMNRVTLQHVKAEARDNILEIGMGNGFFVKELLSIDPSIHYTGCDYSELMVQESIKNNHNWIDQHQAQFIQTSADQLPFEAQHFNKVFTVNTIYFWEDPRVELKEIHRVLKPHGTFILTVRSEEAMKSIPVTQFNFTLYNQVQLLELLSSAGFNVTNVIVQPEPERELFDGKMVKLDSWVFCCKAV